jgi:hypothetical protein
MDCMFTSAKTANTTLIFTKETVGIVALKIITLMNNLI